MNGVMLFVFLLLLWFSYATGGQSGSLPVWRGGMRQRRPIRPPQPDPVCGQVCYPLSTVVTCPTGCLCYSRFDDEAGTCLDPRKTIPAGFFYTGYNELNLPRRRIIKG
uniref:Putative secreted protein n=1 Tax=Amblyomma triste TaxID=251400 RepID=A0A023G1L8_AMBTT